MSAPVTVRLTHQLPGRLRAEVTGLAGAPSLARALAAAAGSWPGVLKAEASAVTGRILIRFNPAANNVRTLLGALAGAGGARADSPRTEVAAALATDLVPHPSPPLGLSSQQAQALLRRHGPNELQAPPQPSFWTRLARQAKEMMMMLLLTGASIAVISGHLRDAITIGVVALTNAVIGAVHEGRADGTMAALQQMSAPTARVLRDGAVGLVAAREIVPGDLLLLEAGDRIAADGQVLEGLDLAVEESMLTGESAAVEKERQARVFAGTAVVRGRGVVLVMATGMETEMGRIAALLGTATAGKTPLQTRMDELGRYVLWGALLVSGLVVGLGLLRGQPLRELLMVGVSVAAAAIPEGLPTFITLGLAAGVRRMAQRGAAVRELAAVETLGCATVICSDKTGTLTQNQMTARYCHAGGQTWELTGTGFTPAGEFRQGRSVVDPLADLHLRRLLILGALCNNARLQEEEQGWRVIGDVTEGALLVAAAKAGIWAADLAAHQVRVGEVPFASERRRMSVLCHSMPPQGAPPETWPEHYLIATKGAPEAVLAVCTHLYEGGTVRPLTAADRDGLLATARKLAGQALRLIAVAYRVSTQLPAGAAETEGCLTFCGLLGLLDPPRPEIPAAIAKCRRAGVKVIMLTGDHQLTAAAVAREIGLLPRGGQEAGVVTGADLTAWSDAELLARVEDLHVCARVSPEQKLRIVRALKARGHVVAMTGDGVNDAPAIKEADIGIAMGRTGTDVTKQAAGLVLMDDNFTTIVAAIEQGRGTYANLRKAVRYLLASNLGEMVLMLAAIVMGLPTPLLAIQLLWINLVGDGAPALSLVAEPLAPDLMERPPRRRGESLFAQGLGRQMVLQGLQMGLAATAVYAGALGGGRSLVVARTMAMVTVGVTQVAYLFRCRRDVDQPQPRLSSNPWTVRAAAVTGVILVGSLYVPWLRQTFALAPLGVGEWAWVGGGVLLGTLPLPQPRRAVRAVRWGRGRPAEPAGRRVAAPVIYLPAPVARAAVAF